MPFTYVGQYVNGLLVDDAIGTTAALTVTHLDGGTIWTTRAAVTPLAGTVPLSGDDDTTRFESGNLTVFGTPGRARLEGTVNGLPFDSLEIIISPDPRDVETAAQTVADLDTAEATLAGHLAAPSDAHDASAVSFLPAGTIGAVNVQLAVQEVATEAAAATAAAVVTAAGDATTKAAAAQAAAIDYASDAVTQLALDASTDATTKANAAQAAAIAAAAADATGKATAAQAAAIAAAAADATTKANTAQANAAADATAKADTAEADAIIAAGLAASAALTAHLDDAIAAHAATAISVTPSGPVNSTTVQAALVEVATEADAALSAHLNDPTGAHAGTAVAFTPTGSVAAVNVQDAIVEVQQEAEAAVTAAAATAAAALAAHLADPADAHDASAVSVTSISGISATDTQGVLAELAAEKLDITAASATYAPYNVTNEQNPLTGWFHVSQFGAAGDDITDDTVEIQAAITAAQAVTYGTVYMPDKYLVSGVLNVGGSHIKLLGSTARQGGQIRSTALTSKIINNTGNNNEFRELELRYTGSPLAGAVAFFSSGPNTIVDSVFIQNCHTGMSFTTGSAQMVSNFQIFDYTSVGVLCQTVNDLYFSKFIINAGSAAGSLGGIRLVDKCEAINFTDGDILLGAFPITTTATVYGIGTRPAYCTFTGVYFDSATGAAQLDKIVESTFVGCWFSNGRSGGGSAGAVLQQTDSLSFVACRFFNCGSTGCNVSANAKRTVFSACMFESNSVTAGVGVAHGLSISANTTDFTISHCIAHNGLFTGQQGYGINVAAGTSDRYVITGNLVSGNATGGVNDGGSGLNKSVAANF